MSDFGDDLGLVGSSNIPWNSVEGAPRSTAPVSEDVRKQLQDWWEGVTKCHHKETVTGLAVDCLPCLRQLLTDVVREERRRTLEEAAQVLDDEIRARERWENHLCSLEELAAAIRALAARGGAGK